MKTCHNWTQPSPTSLGDSRDEFGYNQHIETMFLKEILQLKDTKEAYVIEENNEIFIYRKHQITGYSGY